MSRDTFNRLGKLIYSEKPPVLIVLNDDDWRTWHRVYDNRREFLGVQVVHADVGRTLALQRDGQAVYP